MQNNHTIQETHKLLSKMESDVSLRVQYLKADKKTIDILMTFFFSLIGIVALLNLYFLYDWGLELRSIIHEMNSLQNHINSMTSLMINMGDSIHNIETTTGLIPVINEEMSKFVTSMEGMQIKVHTINQNMGEMNTSFQGITHDLDQITIQVNGLNQQMGNMNQSINSMSKAIP